MCVSLCILQLIHDINRTELISVDEGGQVQTLWTAGLKDTNSNYQQFSTELWVLWAKVWVGLALSICIELRNSHRSWRPVSTADNYSVFMAVVCTETSALRYSTSTVLPDHKHEAVNFECPVWYRPNIIILPCMVCDWVKYSIWPFAYTWIMSLILSSVIFLFNLPG